jgi:arylsulfatase A-like enzyme
MSKSIIISVFIICSILFCDCSHQSKKQVPEKPNILFILIDDMGWGDIGYNSDEILSPNLDRIAAEGIIFEQHYVNPECTPTRVSLMTGKYPTRYGLHCSSASNDQAFPFGTVTLASALKSMGYNTAISGKWHLGSLIQYCPLNYGFDHAYGSLAGALGMYDHRYRLSQPLYSRTWYRDTEYIDEEGHVYDLITDNAIDVLENKFPKNEPFFLYLPYQGVHTPLVETEEWLDHNKQIENPSRRLFAAAVSHLDYQIGRILGTLERIGRQENTLIIVSSDNGGFPNYSGGQYPPPDPPLKDFSSNGPLRGQKGQPYEGGIRVPAFINWPGIIEPGRLQTPVHIADWMPTICNLLGYKSKEDLEWDGQDIWPLIMGDKKTPDQPRRFYWNYWNIRIAIRDGDWKLVIPKEDASPELYYLSDDPYEKNDLANKEPVKLKEMMQLLETEKSLDQQGRAPWLPKNENE